MASFSSVNSFGSRLLNASPPPQRPAVQSDRRKLEEEIRKPSKRNEEGSLCVRAEVMRNDPNVNNANAVEGLSHVNDFEVAETHLRRLGD